MHIASQTPSWQWHTSNQLGCHLHYIKCNYRSISEYLPLLPALWNNGCDLIFILSFRNLLGLLQLQSSPEFLIDPDLLDYGISERRDISKGCLSVFLLLCPSIRKVDCCNLLGLVEELFEEVCYLQGFGKLRGTVL